MRDGTPEPRAAAHDQGHIQMLIHSLTEQSVFQWEWPSLTI